MLGVLIHVIGDAINNVGVIISALVIWKTEGENRYYIDPAVGVFIAIMIFLTALPLTKHSGGILLQIAPGGIDLEDVKHDIEMVGPKTKILRLESCLANYEFENRSRELNQCMNCTFGGSINTSPLLPLMWSWTLKPSRASQRKPRSSWNAFTPTEFTLQRCSLKFFPSVQGRKQFTYLLVRRRALVKKSAPWHTSPGRNDHNVSSFAAMYATECSAAPQPRIIDV